MRTAGPATRSPHALFEFRAHPFDVLPSRLVFLHGDGPADPLVTRERCYVFPCPARFRVGRERLPEISREVVDYSSGDLTSRHMVISQEKAA
jgi:hypothetical protein